MGSKFVVASSNSRRQSATTSQQKMYFSLSFQKGHEKCKQFNDENSILKYLSFPLLAVVVFFRAFQ